MSTVQPRPIRESLTRLTGPIVEPDPMLVTPSSVVIGAMVTSGSIVTSSPM